MNYPLFATSEEIYSENNFLKQIKKIYLGNCLE